jgi:branched-chain amino acid aminotransferase
VTLEKNFSKNNMLSSRSLTKKWLPIAKMQFRSLSKLSSTALQIQKTTSPKQRLPNDKLLFGQTFSDHMMTVEWTAAKGWDKPMIKPYQALVLDPSSTVFHYGAECFEGMKAYKDKSGSIRLFRPDMNMERFHKSCQRLMLPEFDQKELLQIIKEFCKVESNWIPSERGYSLYLRPTAIATQASLGLWY